MTYSIDVLTALKVSGQDNRSKSTDFAGSVPEKNYSFRDSLKQAVRERDTADRRPESQTSLRKELISRSESKLKGLNKPAANKAEKLKPEEAASEEQTDKAKDPIEELLSKLEELSKLQQLGDMPVQKQGAVLEDIKKVLEELAAMQSSNEGVATSELQSRTSELAAKLEAMLKELNRNGSLTSSEASLDFAEELKSLISDTAAKLEAAPEASEADGTARPVMAEQSRNDEITGSTAANNPVDKATAAEKQVKDGTMNNEGKLDAEAPEEQLKGAGTEKPAAETKQLVKETPPEGEEALEEGKTALEGKVEKVTAEEGRKSGDNEADGKKEAPQQAPKTINPSQHKQVNTEAAAVMQEQAAAVKEVETVQNQAASPKPETVNKAEVINQIVKKAEVVITDSKQEMRMQLEPESLGKLTLKLAVEKGLITAKFVAESYEVKQVIESSFSELKDMLQEKGLQVQNFSVSVGQDNKEYNNGGAFQQWKETVKLNGRSMNRGNYDGYETGEASTVRTVNPYSIHNGKFDHKA